MPDNDLLIADDRYSRMRLIAWWDQERLSRAKILVVGAGALGNEVLKNLAMLGIGELFVVDFDRIEASNLTRSILFRERDCGRLKAEAACEMLADINPHVRAVPLPYNIIADIGLGVFRDVDVVIGCLDNREARLWVNRSCWKVNTPWIDGGIQEINGVAKVFEPPDGSCYECAMTENDYRLINLRYSCPLLKQEDILAGKTPTAPTIASIVGGLQVQEALKLLHNMPAAKSHALVFNGQANQFYSTRYPRKEDCLSHETWGEPVELALRAETATAVELFIAARQYWPRESPFSKEPLSLHLERDLVTRLDCTACGESRRVMKPRVIVSHTLAKCGCGETAQPQLEHRVDENGPLAGETLRNLGIPSYDIVRVSSTQGEGFFLLAGDRAVYAR